MGAYHEKRSYQYTHQQKIEFIGLVRLPFEAQYT